MTKLHAIFILIALVSSSVVLANTDFDAHKQSGNAVTTQSTVLAELQQLEKLDAQSQGGFTENDFFVY